MGKYTEKTEISKEEYYMLIGLMAVGSEHIRAVKVVENAIAKILGEKDENGWAGQAAYGDYQAADILKKVGIKVIENGNS